MVLNHISPELYDYRMSELKSERRRFATFFDAIEKASTNPHVLTNIVAYGRRCIPSAEEMEKLESFPSRLKDGDKMFFFVYESHDPNNDSYYYDYGILVERDGELVFRQPFEQKMINGDIDEFPETNDFIFDNL